MGRLLLRRLAQGVPLVLGVIVLNFALIQAAPGSLLDIMTAEQQISDPAMVERLRVLYGMDQPAWMQLLKYIWSVLHLDLGFSYRQNMPVLDVILSQLPATLILMLSSMGLALLVGVAAGVVAAARVNTVWDNVLSLIAVFFFAAPSFWVGIMLVILFSVKLGWLPVGGMMTLGDEDAGLWAQTLDVLRHLVLPTLTLGLFYAATYARVMRASMLEVFGLDFVRTARAKGLGGARVVVRHVLRNALLPIVTLFGLQLGTVLGGSVVVETVFSWPGIGSLLLDSVASRNYPVVLGALIVLVAVAVAIAAPWYFPRNPLRIVGRPELWPFTNPRFPLGTDSMGRDIAAMLAWGARASLIIGLCAALTATVIGVAVGATAAFFGRWVDEVLMRVTEMFQIVPGLVFILSIVSIVGGTIANITVAVGIVSWTQIARLTRAEILSLRDREFVQACRSMGMGEFRILLAEVLPNALPPVIVLASLSVAGAILYESAVSFLGLGDPNVSSWGRLIGEGRTLIRTSWYICAMPGVCIMLLVLALNLVGDGLNDAMNPKLRER